MNKNTLCGFSRGCAFLFIAVICVLPCMIIFSACPQLNLPGERGLKITISGSLVNDDSSRSLYPEAVLSSCRISFEGPHDFDDVVLKSGETTAFVEGLALGAWTITVTGYVKVNGTELPAAQGKDVVTIISNVIQDINIPISVMQQDGVDGSFSFSINYPVSRASEGTIDIKPLSYPGSGSYYKSFNSSPCKDTAVLSPGFYVINIILSADYHKVKKSEILQIYSNLETKAEFSFVDADFTDTITLSGTVDFKVNGSLPESRWINILTAYDYLIASCSIESNGTWSAVLPVFESNVNLKFAIGAAYNGVSIYRDSTNTGVTAKDQNVSSVNLGSYNVTVIAISGTINAAYNGGAISQVYINSSEGGSVSLSSPGANAPWTIYLEALNVPAAVILYVSGYQNFSGANLTRLIFDQQVSSPLLSGVYNSNISGVSVNPGNFPNLYNPPTGTPSLAANVWTNGNITSGSANWYSMSVTAGTTYYLWWNDSISGNGGKTADISVYPWHGSGASAGSPVPISYDPLNHNAWDYPVSFNAGSSGTVYLETRSGDTGTYGIVYNTSGIRPAP